jgi:hypothetical protein
VRPSAVCTLPAVATGILLSAIAGCSGHSAQTASRLPEPPSKAIAVATGPCQGSTAVLVVGKRRVPATEQMTLHAVVGEPIDVQTLTGCAALFGLGYQDLGLLRRVAPHWVVANPGSLPVRLVYDSCTDVHPTCSGGVTFAGTFRLVVTRS